MRAHKTTEAQRKLRSQNLKFCGETRLLQAPKARFLIFRFLCDLCFLLPSVVKKADLERVWATIT